MKICRTTFKENESGKLDRKDSPWNLISIKKLKFELRNGEEFILSYHIDSGYEVNMHFWRLDIMPDLKKGYEKESYVLIIEKGGIGFDSFNPDELLVDERIEFHEVEEIVEYLDKKGYLKRKDWLKKNENQN